jgi:predicted MPP superfamily phosphohydrolase
MILAYGAWNATHTVWRSYEIALEKSAGDLSELRIVMVSDIHLGKIVDNRRLQYLVDQINARQPDLVLLAGDVIDEDIGHFIDQDMASTFRQLQSRFGVFAVLGNHEYIGRETEAAIELMRSGGITMLRDSYLNVDNRFIIAGRDDWDRQRFMGSPRKPLAQWLQGIDPTKPLILMDHQPRELAAAQAIGADLIVSGHTHRGQLYPNHWVTQRLYELDWGYLQKGALHAIVSSGFGTWGPPIRTNANSEIIEIIVKFRPSKK